MQKDLLDSIQIIPFKFQHYPYLIDMLQNQKYCNISNVTYKSLPKIGYIALLGDNPVAAGFLRRVEGNIVAQLDGLTSNPSFGSIIRNEGITKVVDALISDAKRLKLKGIYAFTTDYSILRRSEAIGFRELEHSLIALTLEK